MRRLGYTQQKTAERIGCKEKTVAKWEKRFESTGNVKDRKRSGRPRVTGEEENTNIVMGSVLDPFLTPRRLKQELSFPCSSRTIDRRLQDAGLFGRVAQHKHKYTDDEKKKRLSFAQGYLHWTEKDWERVLFSDEKKFMGAGFCGRVYVRRPRGRALDPEYTVDKKPHPVKVNVWGCISAQGLGYLYIFDQRLDSKLLKHIYDDNLLPSSGRVFPENPRRQWWFLADNDPKHQSRLCQHWLFSHGVTSLDFPPYSPDLNVIEHVWADLARRVEKYRCKTVEELQDVVAAEWMQ
jgi:transposase